MLAVVKSKPERGIEILDRPEPTITAEDQVLLRVEGCGICGSDLGFYNWAPHMLWEIQIPRILGHEVVGTVEAVGPRVTNFKPGDRVVTETGGACGTCETCRIALFNNCENMLRIGQRSDGGFTDFVVVPAINLFRIPADLPLETAVMIETLGSSLHALERLHLTPGDRVLVMGPGPIGMTAALLSRVCGASEVKVTGLPHDAGRLELARSLGFETLTVDQDDISEEVNRWSEGRGVDVVLDATGGPGSLNEALGYARIGGTIGLLGISPAGHFDLRPLKIKELSLIGTFRRQPSSWHRSIRMVASGVIDVAPLVTHYFSVSQAEQAFQALEQRRGTKIVITPENGR
jgi:L-iditol 2-dehydrogenase